MTKLRSLIRQEDWKPSVKHDTDRTQFLDVKDFLNKMASDEQLMASAKKVKGRSNSAA